MTETVAAIEEDIRRLAEQERLLRIARFGPQEAFALGLILREIALARAAPIAIDISLRDRPLFHCALPAARPTTPNGSGASATPCSGSGARLMRSVDRSRCRANPRRRR